MKLDLLGSKMVPLDAERLEDLMKLALRNIDIFSGDPYYVGRFQGWLDAQPGEIQRLAAKRPLAKLYRVITDNELEGQGAPMLLGVVIGYKSSTRGMPATCGVFILGIKSGNGSYEDPIFVPAEALEDVTERARAGKITFQ
jgi:hypothetical protein